MAYPGTFVAGQVLTAAEMNAINEGASARPLLTGGAYIDGTNGLVLSGLSGNYASTPDSAALSITGDIDIKAKVTLPNWSTPSATAVTGKWVSPATNRSFYFVVWTNGTLILGTSADGTNTIQTFSTAATGVSAGGTKWIRATMDVDNGLLQRVAKFYTSDDGTTWTQLGTTVTTAGATSIFDGTAPLEVGSIVNGSTWNMNGTVHRVIVQSAFDTADNTTSVVFDADFEAEAADTLAFTEDSGNAATVSVTTTRYTVGIPNVQVNAITTDALSADNDRFQPFRVFESIDVDLLAFEVTTGPASAATMYLALYEADDNYQPNGSPLVTASVAVGSAATGVFYAQVTPVRLKPGAYLVAHNPSVTLTTRMVRGGETFMPHTIGANALIVRPLNSRTAGTFTTSEFTTLAGATTTQRHNVLLRWKAV